MKLFKFKELHYIICIFNSSNKLFYPLFLLPNPKNWWVWEPLSKIDEFGRTHRTHTNDATEIPYDFKQSSLTKKLDFYLNTLNRTEFVIKTTFSTTFEKWQFSMTQNFLVIEGNLDFIRYIYFISKMKRLLL